MTRRSIEIKMSVALLNEWLKNKNLFDKGVVGVGDEETGTGEGVEDARGEMALLAMVVVDSVQDGLVVLDQTPDGPAKRVPRAVWCDSDP